MDCTSAYQKDVFTIIWSIDSSIGEQKRVQKLWRICEGRSSAQFAYSATVHMTLNSNILDVVEVGVQRKALFSLWELVHL